MINKDNKYTKMQSDYYENGAKEMAVVNHRQHDKNFNYWKILLKPIREDSGKWHGKRALDFACGTGRNISNLLRMAHWKNVCGADIAKNNLVEAERILKEENVPYHYYELFKNNGVDLDGLEDNFFDFIMSTIAFQHIAVYDIRYNLFKELYRVLKTGGTFSFQMGYGEGHGKAEYLENAYDAKGTNTKHDVIVRSADQLKDDLVKIGFKDFKHVITDAFSDGHPHWIFVTVTK